MKLFGNLRLPPVPFARDAGASLRLSLGAHLLLILTFTISPAAGARVVVQNQHASFPAVPAHLLALSHNCTCEFKAACSCEAAVHFMDCISVACSSGHCACASDGPDHFHSACQEMNSRCPAVGLECHNNQATCERFGQTHSGKTPDVPSFGSNMDQKQTSSVLKSALPAPEAHSGAQAETAKTNIFFSGPGDIGEQVTDHVGDGVSRTAAKVRRANVSMEKMYDDLGRFQETMMPGYKFNHRVFFFSLIVIVAANIWFAAYFCLIYRDDVVERYWKYQQQVMKVEDHGTPPPSPRHAPEDFHKAVMHSDVVLAFHNPNKDGDAKNEAVTLQTIDRVIHPHSGEVDDVFSRVQKAMGIQRKADAFNRSDDFMNSLFVQSTTTFEAVGEEALEDITALGCCAVPTYGGPTGDGHTVRVAILQDLVQMLEQRGFEVTPFTSFNGDHIFVCVGLPDEKVAQKFLVKNQMALQVSHDVVKKLKIKQPEDEAASATPHMYFDRRIVKALYSAGVIERDDASLLYRSFFGRSGKGSIVSSRERIRIICKELFNVIDLDAAANRGLIYDWYPLHSRHSLNLLEETWSGKGFWTDTSFQQPIPLIREYFGSRVAFTFAWVGFICKGLLALLPIALVAEAMVEYAKWRHDVDMTNTRDMFGPGIILLIWMRILLNYWDAECEYLTALFTDADDVKELIRPGFRGFVRPSVVDANIEEHYYPPFWYNLRRAASAIFTFLACVVVMCCIYTWMSIFEGRMNWFASLMLAVQIKVFELVYNSLIYHLLRIENHKYQSAFYNSYISKQMLFQSVNNYSAFLYLAFVQPYTKTGCPSEEGCLGLLREQLVKTQVILTLCMIAQLIITRLSVYISLWFKYKGKPAEDCCYVEEQQRFATYRTQEQIEFMTQLMISLGFVLLFGCVCPLMVLFSFFVFTVSLRGYSGVLSTNFKRAVPRVFIGIGACRDVLGLLQVTSLFTTGLLCVTYGRSFRGANVMSQVTGCLLFGVGGAVVWGIIDMAYSNKHPLTEVLSSRREHVRSSIHKHISQYQIKDDPTEVTPAPTQSRTCTALLEENWSGIPKFSLEHEQAVRSA